MQTPNTYMMTEIDIDSKRRFRTNMECLGHSIRLTLALFLLGLCIRNLSELHGKLAGNLMLLLVTYMQFDIDVNSAPDQILEQEFCSMNIIWCNTSIRQTY